MNTEINKKIELKEKFLNFYNNNKFKLYFFNKCNGNINFTCFF